MTLQLPDEFDSFWADAVGEVHHARLDFHRSLRNEFDKPGFVVETFTFRGIDGVKRHGWFAYPEGAHRAPAFVWLPPYGRESVLPNAYGTRNGFASMSLNFHGHEAFHQEKYQPARGYFADGAADPSTWIFRRMFQDAYLVVRILQAQIEVDEERIAAMGMSQGGGMSVWLGAFCSIIKAVCADMVFLSAIEQSLQRQVYRYPLKELTDFMDTIPVGRERVLNTVSYFDTVNVATRCRVPTQVSLGLRDPAAKPDNVRACFEALPGHKRLISYDWGHDWHPDMVENNRRWLVDCI
jgi:cephalosporin-C deacetylase